MRKYIALRLAATVAAVPFLTLSAIAATPSSAGPAGLSSSARVWNVDTAHTEVNFSVKHFFTPITGSFQDYDVELMFDKDDPANSKVSARIAVGSVNTGNEGRDNHLRSDDWFEADKYPYITFESSSVRQISETALVAVGDLTIKDVTRRVELPIELLGLKQIPEQMRGMMGGITEATGFSTGLEINRNEFNVGVGSWAATMIVGDQVNIQIRVEANHK